MLAGYSTAELESLVANHPYFAQAHVLLAKKYQQETNPKFDKQLQLAVLYTNNRELLFEIFNDRLILILSFFKFFFDVKYTVRIISWTINNQWHTITKCFFS